MNLAASGLKNRKLSKWPVIVGMVWGGKFEWSTADFMKYLHPPGYVRRGGHSREAWEDSHHAYGGEVRLKCSQNLGWP